MFHIRRVLISVLAGSFLLSPSFAHAQFTVDSFFDIGLDVQLPDPQCDPCEQLRRDIALLEAEIAGLGVELDMLDEMLTDFEGHMENARKQLAEAEAELKELTDPQNYVESDGHRYDSADHAAMGRRSAKLWEQYKAGKLSAQEYSDEVGKNFDDPDVRKELDAIKKDIEKELKDGIKETKDNLTAAEKTMKEWNKIGAEISAKTDAKQEELNRYRDVLADCEKRCTEETVNLPEDYDIGQESRGFFGWLKDLFGGGDSMETLPNGGTILLPPFPDPLGGIPPMPPTFGGEPLPSGAIPTEMIPMGLGGPPLLPPLPDPFGLLPPAGVPLPPPVCHVCDPIRKEIADAQAQLDALKAQLAALQMEQAMTDAMLTMSKGAQEAAQNALDEFNNPTDYVEDDQGRRYDSSDHAAMRERNARLWARYRAGRLSADQLNDEWGKNFDDPDVQNDLDTIKNDIRKNLEKTVNDTKQQTKDLEAKAAKIAGQIADIEAKIAKLEALLANLRVRLTECEKECQEPEFMLDMTLLNGLEDVARELGGILTPKNDPIDDDEDPENTENDVVTGDFALPYGCCDDEGGANDCKPCEDENTTESVKTNFLCDWFDIFCPKEKEEPSDYTFDDIERCGSRPEDSKCEGLDHDNNDVYDERDLNLMDFSLKGPNDLVFPLDISNMDGKPELTFDDLPPARDCLIGGGDCSGLGFDLPGNDTLNNPDVLGLGAGSFGLYVQNGSDILLGDPLDRDLIGIGGGGNDIIGGGPSDIQGDIFNPGTGDPFSGPPSGGIGLDIFGQGGDDIIPPPPSSSEQDMANDPQVQQVVQAAVQRYLQSNPLGPCEKLAVTVRRVRVGNRVRYTVTIRRIRDESLCPIPQCPPETSYRSVGEPTPESCSQACQNGRGGCAVLETLSDGTTCILCGPPELCGDGNVDFGEECDDGNVTSGDGCSAECTIEAREDPQYCGNGIVDGSEQCETDAHCDSSMKCNVESCTCEEPKSSVKCPDLAYEDKSSCASSCNGACEYRPFEDIMCYFCIPSDLPPRSESSSSSSQSSVEQCDAPTMPKAACENSCDGACDRSYTTIGGLECFECLEFEQPAEPICGNGSIESGEQCDGSGCGSNEVCTDSCTCRQIEDTGPSCPSGTTSQKAVCESQCGPQGGVCVDEGGCFSCVVVNCPQGTSKECPSNCQNGCDIVGSQHGVNCFQCKQSCEDVCAQNGYGGPNTDHSNSILAELNGYSCVSGASVSIQTATIGSCQCVGEYSLSVDTTPPVCTGTPCGDVACGSSATCADGDTQITVNCNWGGWEKIQKHQFRPKLGN